MTNGLAGAGNVLPGNRFDVYDRMPFPRLTVPANVAGVSRHAPAGRRDSE